MFFQDELNICTRTDAFFFLYKLIILEKKNSDLIGIQICEAEALE